MSIKLILKCFRPSRDSNYYNNRLNSHPQPNIWVWRVVPQMYCLSFSGCVCWGVIKFTVNMFTAKQSFNHFQTKEFCAPNSDFHSNAIKFYYYFRLWLIGESVKCSIDSVPHLCCCLCLLPISLIELHGKMGALCAMKITNWCYFQINQLFWNSFWSALDRGQNI